MGCMKFNDTTSDEGFLYIHHTNTSKKMKFFQNSLRKVRAMFAEFMAFMLALRNEQEGKV